MSGKQAKTARREGGIAKSDPGLYKSLAKPFESDGEARRSLEAFGVALGELRKLHGIPDVVCIAQVVVKNPDGGDPLVIPQIVNYGDARLAPNLAGVAFGYFRQKLIDEQDASAQMGANAARQGGGQ